jgi:hypothetical protein
MKKILGALKKIIDKQYYKYYTLDRETLIRQMFPGIHSIWEYTRIDIFFRNNGPEKVDEIIKLIWTYYRWEVERLNMEWKFSEIERYQWIVDFIQAIKDYQEYILTEK